MVDTKDKILAAAIDLFSELGFRGTTTRRICERADVNGAALNYHWNTKTALWAAACAWAGESLFDAVRQRFDPASPAAETIRRVVGDTFDALVVDPRPIQITAWASLESDSFDFGIASEHFQPIVRFGEAYLAQAAGADGIAPIDYRAALATYWGMVLVVFIDQPGHQVFFGTDLTDPAHASRMRASLIASALAILGLSG